MKQQPTNKNGSRRLKNTDKNDNVIISRMTVQPISGSGGTALPTPNSYFSFQDKLTYSSGGTSKVSSNTVVGSSNLPTIVAYHELPVTAGTAIELERHYPPSYGSVEKLDKDGSFIIKPGQSICVKYITDATSASVYSSISFYIEVPE